MEKLIQSTICFGEFNLSSGYNSNYYFDIRKLFSKPNNLNKIISKFKKPHKTNNIHICGVPYSAIPLATIYSNMHNISQIVLRKRRKEYGRKQMIEGQWKVGDEVILIDDVWTTGNSMYKAQQILKKEGLIVKRMLVILLRNSSKYNYGNLEYLFTEDDLLNRTPIIKFKKHLYNYGKLCFAADLNTSEEIIEKIYKIGHDISVLKLHPELIDDWDYTTIAKFRGLADEYQFLLWVDIKICEVPHIAIKQLEPYNWADLISVMSIVGNNTLNKLNELAKDLNVMLILVPSLHTEGKLIWNDNTNNLLINNCTHIVGSVGIKMPNLVYIKAGINENDDLTDVDLIVKGRSLI